MKVRLITINDAEEIFNIQKKTWLNLYPNEKYSIKYEDILKKFADKTNIITKIKKKINNYEKNIFGWVVELDDKIIGFATIYREKEKDELGAIYILPEHQGKGIGSILLQKALDLFKDSKEIWLEVAIYNENAIRFYQKFGFHIVSETEGKHKIIEEKFIPTIKMKREQ